MLRIDPGTGAVARGFAGSGSPGRAAAVLVATLGLAGLGSLVRADLASDDGFVEPAPWTSGELHEVELTDDLAVGAPPSGGTAAALPSPDDEPDALIERRTLSRALYDADAEADLEIPTLEPALDETGAAADEDVGVGAALPAHEPRGLSERRAERLRGVAWGVSSCLKRDHTGARAAFDRLQGRDREQLVDVCMRHGMLLP